MAILQLYFKNCAQVTHRFQGLIASQGFGEIYLWAQKELGFLQLDRGPQSGRPMSPSALMRLATWEPFRNLACLFWGKAMQLSALTVVDTPEPVLVGGQHPSWAIED